LRPLPEDLEAEKALLSTLCAPGAEATAAEMVAQLQEADFTHPNHRRVFVALRSLVQKGSEVSAVGLLDELGKAGKAMGGMVVLVDILSGEEVGRPQILVDILTKHRRRRELIRLGAQVQAQAQDGDDAPELIADTAARALADLMASRNRGGLVEAKDSTQRILDALKGGAQGTLTGFNRLDGMTQGFQPGQFIILAARPGIGKTTLALNWTLSAVMGYGWVAYFSLEMMAHELTRRAACDLGSVPQKAVKERNLSQGQLENFLRAVATLETLPLLINDQAAIGVQQIRAQVMREATRRGTPPAMIVVDHIGLMGGETVKGQTDAARIGAISGELKRLAKDAQAPVVALSQMNREIEKERRRPRLSDLRDSGSLEQDADIVCFLHRDAKPQMGQDQLDKSATLIIAKHRDGELGEIPMQFEGGFCRYEEAPERHTGTDDGRGWA